MAGFLSGVGDLLKNPAVMELLPAALGAAGGALTSPRLGGARGSIGNAMLGGAQGLALGSKAAAEAQLAPAEIGELQQRTAYMAQQTKQMQQAATNDQVWSANYGKWVDQLPADKQSEARIFGQSTDPKDRLKAVQMIKDEMARPVSEKFLSKMTGINQPDLAGLPTESLHDLMNKAIAARTENRKFEIKNTDKGLMSFSEDPMNPGKMTMTTLGAREVSSAAPDYKAVNLEGGTIGVYDGRTGRMTNTGVRGTVGSTGAAGAVNDAQTAKAITSHYEGLAKENQVVEKANAANDYPGAVPKPLPHPNLGSYDDYVNSADGQAFINAYKGVGGPSEPGKPRPKEEAAKPAADELKSAPDWRTVEVNGVRAKERAVAKTKYKDGEYDLKGKRYIIKDGYGYPA
jgi:hypothetical protein